MIMIIVLFKNTVCLLFICGYCFQESPYGASMVAQGYCHKAKASLGDQKNKNIRESLKHSNKVKFIMLLYIYSTP